MLLEKSIPWLSLVFFFPPSLAFASALNNPARTIDNGEVWAWGCNRYGQLGLEEDAPKLLLWERAELLKDSEQPFQEDDFVHPAPMLLTSLCGIRVLGVKCGGSFSMVVSESGQLFSFGWGMYGQVC